mmetsp:Transcript_40469/g.107274  ORF Transcript_40469/g.107274 Transcript_40469/m.107274 type:complete len:269 (+) Transcript_40469:695-1501(+)
MSLEVRGLLVIFITNSFNALLKFPLLACGPLPEVGVCVGAMRGAGIVSSGGEDVKTASPSSRTTAPTGAGTPAGESYTISACESEALLIVASPEAGGPTLPLMLRSSDVDGSGNDAKCRSATFAALCSASFFRDFTSPSNSKVASMASTFTAARNWFTSLIFTKYTMSCGVVGLPIAFVTHAFNALLKTLCNVPSPSGTGWGTPGAAAFGGNVAVRALCAKCCRARRAADCSASFLSAQLSPSKSTSSPSAATCTVDRYLPAKITAVV